MKERTSASDEKFQNNFEILPYTVVNIRQVIKGFTFPLTHRHLFTDLSLGKMSASETALSANMNNLEVRSTSAFNTPISGTPIPTTTLSSETLALLTEAATKLKDPVSKSSKGVKRKRTQSPFSPTNNRVDYPAATKPLYLKAKTLYRRKLNLATNIHSIKVSLKSGTFPVQCNFRSSPPISLDEDFKKKWMEITARSKRELTLLWVDELNRKYANIKVEIQSTLAEMETHLDQHQFKEIQDSLTEKFKSAAPVSLQKRLKTSEQTRAPQPPKEKRNRNQTRPQPRNQDRQLKQLLNGLSKLIQARK